MLSGITGPSCDDTPEAQSRRGYSDQAHLPTDGPYWTVDQGRFQEKRRVKAGLKEFA